MNCNDPFPKHYFARYDESNDRSFYKFPRLTVHIDEGARAALGQIFLETLPPHGTFLDLMSSYRSHFPEELPVHHMVGLGLNDIELRQNPQLNDYLVHDLNYNPVLPFDDASFDGAVCSVSIQYLTRPVQVFAEVGRVLRPGAPFVVSFSNRCFPSKAVYVWMATSDDQHIKLLQQYFECADCFTKLTTHKHIPRGWFGDPLYTVVGWCRSDVL